MHQDTATGHTNAIGLALSFIVLPCRRLCRTLLHMFSVRVLMPDWTTVMTHPPAREHPMLRAWIGKVKDSVPTHESLGTGIVESASVRLYSS